MTRTQTVKTVAEHSVDAIAISALGYIAAAGASGEVGLTAVGAITSVALGKRYYASRTE